MSAGPCDLFLRVAVLTLTNLALPRYLYSGLTTQKFLLVDDEKDNSNRHMQTLAINTLEQREPQNQPVIPSNFKFDYMPGSCWANQTRKQQS